MGNIGFEQRKKESCVAACDNSLKKSIDEGVVPICDLLNNTTDYFTTSSCSGRIVLYREYSGKDKEFGKNPWLLISHTPITYTVLLDSVKKTAATDILEGVVYFKFEPMIMHIEAKELEDARRLLAVAVQAGFRNSGISISKQNRIIVAVRCTLKLDVPLVLQPDGSFAHVTEDYVRWLVDLANEKMSSNNALIMRLFEAMRGELQNTKNSLLI